ncbi:hypothetical protein [Lewinella sp. 4G2]|uniref:hypothetical protein n=1 Tax=Lewinella sp. 4G2 TaxID=1803372 RepID=UPI0012FAB729|nr:hypothetical protein [Lewinella sp. 4G2]
MRRIFLFALLFCFAVALPAQSTTATTVKTTAVEKLDLRPKQEKALLAIAKVVKKEIALLREQGEFYVGSPALRDLRHKEERMISEVLTEKQYAKYKELEASSALEKK